MLQTLKNAWKVAEIRKKILWTLFILLLYRVGTVIPVPFVDASQFSSQFGDTILGYLDTLSGGSLQTATLFALGISPYITASIVVQLLTVAIPALERWAQQGEEGKKKINNLTRYFTVILAVITAVGYYFLMKNSGWISADGHSEVLVAFVIIVCYCAGASLVMWLGEKINEFGLGNGISIILFANIISALPSKIIRLVNLAIYGFKTGNPALWGSVAIAFALGYILLLLAMVVFSVFVTGSERRIPVQYAKRVVGRKMYGGQSQNLPLKLNMSGVMPVIFASSLISLPATIMAFCGVASADSFISNRNAAGQFVWKNFWQNVNTFLAADGWFYPLILFVLIIAFSYFYIQISFNPVEVANNLKKNGGMILGHRPGAPTADYIRKSLSKVTLIGAFFLSVVAIVPIIIVPLAMEPIAEEIVRGFIHTDPTWVNQFLIGAVTNEAEVVSQLSSYFTSAFAFGGTSLLIVVGVALETVRDLEAQLSMRNYKGFLK